jgi:hypothetical protein
MSRSLFFLFFSLFSQSLPLVAQADMPKPAIAQVKSAPSENGLSENGLSESGLNESKVRKVLSGMREANQQKNAAGVTQAMANFIVSRNRFIMPKQTLDTTVYGKSQHLSDLEGEFSGTTGYKYHGYQAKVNVCPDRSFAVAQENYLLEVQLQTGERVLFAIASSTKFVLIDGEAKIYAVSSTVEMENPIASIARVNPN